MPSCYPKHPTTLGQHIRQRRMDLKLLQSDLAQILGVSTYCITYWETSRSIPQINYFPKIHRFLGYCPIKFKERKFSGRLKAYRWKNGLSYKRLGDKLGINGSTVRSWEMEKTVPSKIKCDEIEALLQDI